MKTISRAPKKAFIYQMFEGGSHEFGSGMTGSCLATANALKNLGYDVVPFSKDKLPPKYKITPETPIKGTTGIVKFLYERMFPGVTYPNIDIPKPLLPFARRKIHETTLGTLRKAFPTSMVLSGVALHKPLFIKPKYPKLFSGISFDRGIPRGLSHLPDDTEVFVHSFREFGKEIRLYVSSWTGPLHEDDLYVDCYPESKKTLDRLVAFGTKVHNVWKDQAPKSYILDVGLSTDGGPKKRPLPTIVEINSVLTAGNLQDCRSGTNHPGRMVRTAWASYARYGERGEF